MAKARRTLQQRADEARLRLELERSKIQTRALREYGKSLAQSNSYPQTRRHRMRTTAGGVRPGGGGAAHHLDARSHDELRRDAQHLQRTSVQARAFLRSAGDLIAGAGPRVRASMGTTLNRKETNRFADAERRAEELWQDWFEGHSREQESGFDLRRQMDGPEYLRQLIRAMLTDGDQLMLPVTVDGDPGTLQFIESERIVNPGGVGSQDRFVPIERATETAPAGGIVSGVYVDGYMRPTGYHVCDYAPDLGSLRWIGEGRKVETKRGASLLRCPLQARVNELRGEPGLAAVIERLENLDAMSSSVRAAYYNATCLAIILTSPNPGALQSGWAGETVARVGDPAATQDKLAELEPGSIWHAPIGSEAKQVDPKHPSQQFDRLVDQELTMIGADLGLPWMLVSGNSETASYSSYRASIGLAFNGFKSWRQWAADRVLTPLYRWKLRQWWAMELIDIPPEAILAGTYDRCLWTFPPPPMLDPLAEFKAFAEGIRTRLISRQDAVSQLNGGQLEELYGQVEYELGQERDRKIQPHPQPGAPGEAWAEVVEEPNAGKKPDRENQKNREEVPA